MGFVRRAKISSTVEIPEGARKEIEYQYLYQIVNAIEKWLQDNSRSLTLEEKIVAVVTQDMVVDDNLKKQLKTELCILVYYPY